jgi:ubiquinone/menaquinone biosynthesis C-methylase UbiE
MEEERLKALASQLRQPQGDFGRQVGEKMNEGNAHMNRYTIERLRISPQDRILEIGMGNGFFVKEILAVDPSVRYTGCDFSETMVEAANRLNAPFVQSGQARFFLAGADRLPFNENAFNKIFTVNTVYFWEEPKKIFAELSRVLESGGQLLISIRPKAVMEQLPMVKYGFRTFTADTLPALIAENSWRLVDLIEKSEPDQDFMGQKVQMGTVIAVAEKDGSRA